MASKELSYNFDRSAMRAVAALLTIPGADKHPQLNEFVTQVLYYVPVPKPIILLHFGAPIIIVHFRSRAPPT